MFIGILFAIAVFALDQAHKIYMVEGLQLKAGYSEAYTSYFNIVMVWNNGVSFGMLGKGTFGQYQPLILVFITLVIVAFLLNILRKSDNFTEKMAFGLIIGGAMGNAADRIHWGKVADFFDFHVSGWHWPAFNVADIFICVGVALFVYTNILNFGKSNNNSESKNVKEQNV